MSISNQPPCFNKAYEYLRQKVVTQLVNQSRRNQTSNSSRNISARLNQPVINDDALKRKYSKAFDSHFKAAKEMAFKLPTGALLTYALAPTVGLAPLSITAAAFAIRGQHKMPPKMIPFILVPFFFYNITKIPLLNLVLDRISVDDKVVKESIANFCCGVFLGDTVVMNNSETKYKVPVTFGFVAGVMLSCAAYAAVNIGTEILSHLHSSSDLSSENLMMQSPPKTDYSTVDNNETLLKMGLIFILSCMSFGVVGGTLAPFFIDKDFFNYRS